MLLNANLILVEFVFNNIVYGVVARFIVEGKMFSFEYFWIMYVLGLTVTAEIFRTRL